MKAMILLALAVAGLRASRSRRARPIRSPARAMRRRWRAMVGRAWSDSLRAEVLRLSGARALRVIRPGDMVTMDFRGDRLNVHLTGDGRIERFACG